MLRAVWLLASLASCADSGTCAAGQPECELSLVSHVYIIHYTPNVERKQFMLKQIKALGIEERTTFVEVFDREVLNRTQINRYYKHFRFLEAVDDPALGGYASFFPFHIEPGDISVNMKHYEALRLAAESKHRYSLILEDDAVLRGDDFVSKLESYVQQLDDSKGGMLHIGDSLGTRDDSDDCDLIPECSAHKISDAASTRQIYLKKRHPEVNTGYQIGSLNVMRASEAYVVSLEAAQALSTAYLPIAFSVDCHLCYLVNLLQISTYWSHPALVSQGTDTGILETWQKGKEQKQKERQSPAHQVEMFKKAIKLRPDHHRIEESYFALGVNLGKLKQHDKTIDALEKAIEHNPAHHTSLNNLAAVFVNMNQLEIARDYLEQAVAVAPTKQDYKNSLASIEQWIKEDSQ